MSNQKLMSANRCISMLIILTILMESINSQPASIKEIEAGQSLSLQIVEPKYIAELYQNHSLDYTIANFGKIPYDRQLVGHLHTAIPYDGCRPIDNNKDTKAPVLLVQRGNCTFTQKALHAQLAGASLLIIQDNLDESEANLSLIGDGHNQDVVIPTIMISRMDGVSLLHYLDTIHSTTPNQSLVVNVKFPRMVHRQHTVLQLWVSSGDYRSMDTTRQLLSEYQSSFQKDTNVVLDLHFFYYQCVYCKGLDFQVDNEDCVNGGRYCSPDPDYDGPLTGREVILENLKQECLYQHSHPLYLRYLQQYIQQCFQAGQLVSTFTQCVQDIHKQLDIPQQIHQCVYNAFADNNDLNKGDNLVLKAERQLYVAKNIHTYPQLLINDIIYKGNIQGEALVQAICHSFTPEKIPEHCLMKGQQQSQSSSVVHHSHLVWYLLVAVIVFILALFFYRRLLKREMQKEMQLQVNSAISQYYALSDKKNDNTIDVKTI